MQPTVEQRGEISLAASGFKLTFDLLAPSRGSPHEPVFFKSRATLQSIALGESVLSTFVTGLLSDLTDLCDRIDGHINQLVDHQHIQGNRIVPVESRAWVPLDLGIVIQCLSGKVRSEGEALVGGFAIRIMLDIARDPHGKMVGAGVVGEVKVQEAFHFTQAMREYVAGFERPAPDVHVKQ